jgi:hypothetical protein
MTFQEIISLVPPWLWVILIGILGMIKIPIIEINIWSIVGKAINGEVLEKVNTLTEELNRHIHMEEEEKMRNVRAHILRFNDEILLDRKHSKEHFEEILQDIDMYEKYCNSHPDYKNNKAVLAIETIKTVYKKCLEQKDFLTYKPKDGE